MQVIHVKYFSSNMYMTLDLTKVFEVIFEMFGDITIVVEPMNEREREKATDIVDDIIAVKERFAIFTETEKGKLTRCKHIEERIVLEGQK